MARPERERYYTSVEGFPKSISSEMDELNIKLEEQLVRFLNLSERYIAYLGYLKEGGNEPKSFAYENKVVVQSMAEGELEIDWQAVPPKLLEIFDYFGLSEQSPLKIKIEKEGTSMSMGTAFNSQSIAHPVISEFDTFPKAAKVNITIGNNYLSEALNFVAGFDQYAHHSRSHHLPPQLGYFLEVNVKTQDEQVFNKSTGHVAVLLNSPIYTPVRYGVFESLYYWLDEMLSKEQVRLVKAE